MAFEPKTWADGAEGGTPITAKELNRIEQGVLDGQNVAPTWDSIEGKPSLGDLAFENLLPWNDIQGKPNTFPPDAHTHTVEDVEGLASALNGKADSSDIPDVSGFALQSSLEALEARVLALETDSE